MVRSYRSQGTQDRLVYSFGAEWRCAAEKGGSHAPLRCPAVLGVAKIGVILRFCGEDGAAVGVKSAWEPPFSVGNGSQGSRRTHEGRRPAP